MRAAIYDRPGDPSVLHLADVAEPVLANTELLIRVEAISIEGGDLIGRRSMLQRGSDLLGYAAAGEIVDVGSAVSGFAIGQKVTTFAFKGSHAELRAVPAATSWIIPDGLDVKVASAIPVGPGTAAIALQMGALKHGDTVLITGAAGGVGLAAVQLAARAGARVIGTGTTRETLEELRHIGLSDAIVVGEISTTEQIRGLIGGSKVDLLIDCVGGSALVDGIHVLRNGGCAVMVGVFGGMNQPIDAGYLLFHRLTVMGCLLGSIMGEPGPRTLIQCLLEQALDGSLKIPLDAIFPFSEVAAAHRRAETRGRIGRVVMVP